MSQGFELPPPNARTLPENIQCSDPPNYRGSDKSSKIIGSLVGLAVGDALGAHVEFRPHDYILANRVQSMQGGGTWGLKAGQWTDDTSMALCLASSLITHHGYNPYDQLVRYKWWYQKGFLSATGNCFDIGGTTRAALEEFLRRQNEIRARLQENNDDAIDRLSVQEAARINPSILKCGIRDKAGNGPLMRLAPIPLFYFRQPARAVQLAGDSAALTHDHPEAIDACRYYAALIVAAVSGVSKDELLNDRFYDTHISWFNNQPLCPAVSAVARGSFKRPRGYDDGIRGAGYIVKSLEAALWAFWSDKDSFKEGACNAVNLGDDTDTTAAIYGQLAGAYYGYDKLPQNWLEQLYARNLIIKFAQWLDYEGSRSTMDSTRLPSQNFSTQQPSFSTTFRMPTSHGNMYRPPAPQPGSITQPGRIGYDLQTREQRPRLDPSKLRTAGKPSGGYH